jgi:hypothetical protein
MRTYAVPSLTMTGLGIIGPAQFPPSQLFIKPILILIQDRNALQNVKLLDI